MQPFIEDPRLRPILERVEGGERLSYDDGVALYQTADILALGYMANLVRERLHGSTTYFNVNRHINPTDVCVASCRLCAFGKRAKDPKAYTMSLDQVWHVAGEGWTEAVTEFHIVGGLHPELTLDWYCEMLRGLKERFPQVHLKAFTMVEIALCLGVIAFALVAIIGVLPTGIRVQKDNREDTILNQEGLLLVEAIRSGSRGLDYLTNYFDTITTSNAQGTIVFVNPQLRASIPGQLLTNGLQIVSLLTLPKYDLDRKVTNHVVARVRAITGSAAEKTLSARDMAFAYQVIPEVVPLSVHPPDSTNYQAAAASARRSAAPEPIEALLQGLTCRLTPDRAISSRSRGDSQTPCTSAVFDLRKPSASRCSTMLRPQNICAVTACSRVSRTWMIVGKSSSSASARQSRRKPSVQRCGAEGATMTPTRDVLG